VRSADCLHYSNRFYHWEGTLPLFPSRISAVGGRFDFKVFPHIGDKPFFIENDRPLYIVKVGALSGTDRLLNRLGEGVIHVLCINRQRKF